MAIAVFAVSKATIGLADTDSVAVFDIEEAADFVAEGLPAEIDDRLDRATVVAMITWQLEYLRSRGLATFGGVDDLAREAPAAGKGPIIADEDEVVDAVLAAGRERDLELDALDVVVVLDLTTQYLVAIGAVGPTVGEPVDPDNEAD